MVFDNLGNVAGNDDTLSISVEQESILKIDDTIQNDKGKKTLIAIFFTLKCSVCKQFATPHLRQPN